MSRTRRTRVALAWLPAVSYTMLIWWLSSQALHVPYIARVPLQDKGVHFLEYGALGLFIAHAVVATFRERGIRAVLIASFMTIGLGFLDELHQAFVPGRFSDALDLLADSIGAVTFATLYVVLIHVLRIGRDEPKPEGAETEPIARASDPSLK